MSLLEKNTISGWTKSSAIGLNADELAKDGVQELLKITDHKNPPQ